MGRKSLKRTLNVWMNGILVGEWSLSGESTFRYDPQWLTRNESRPLSLSLPLSSAVYKGPLVESFFDNLLPDAEEIRRRLRSQYSLSSKSSFALLYEIGRDCIGAIQLLPEDRKPEDLKTIQGRPADDAILESLMLTGSGSLSRRIERVEFRISLAGAQEKTAFLRHGDKWMIPEGTTPTTHIFKLPLGRIGNGEIDPSTSVENEWLCSLILQEFGIETAKCEMAQFSKTKALIVERFDRQVSEDRQWIIRLPQEDFCQATGRPSALKYESDGGPGIREIMDILRGSRQADRDRMEFFKAQIVFYLLAAVDGHAKNFSIFILQQGRYRLTPVYDVLSLHPVMANRRGMIHPKRAKMAMAVFGDRSKTYQWDHISRRHWYSTARETGFPEEHCEALLNEILEKLPDVIERVKQKIPAGFPDTVSERIFKGMKEASERLL